MSKLAADNLNLVIIIAIWIKKKLYKNAFTRAKDTVEKMYGKCNFCSRYLSRET